MAPALHLLTILSVLMHSVLGCCSHHQHGHESTSEHIAGAEWGVDCPMRRCSSLESGPGSTGNERHPPCHEGACTYLSTVAAPVVRIAGCTAPPATDVLARPAVVIVTRLTAHAAIPRPTHCVATRATLQVWRI